LKIADLTGSRPAFFPFNMTRISMDYPLHEILKSLAGKDRFQLHLGSVKHFSELLFWVVSRRLANSYLESVPTSELGATTDIRRAPRHAHVIDSVLPSSANSCPSRITSEGKLCSNPGRLFLPHVYLQLQTETGIQNNVVY
jgi:hypothetical protein